MRSLYKIDDDLYQEIRSSLKHDTNKNNEDIDIFMSNLPLN